MSDFNLSNFSHDWVYSSFKPFINVIPFFWDIFFIIIGVYIYVQSGKNTFTTAIYLFGVWALFGLILSAVTLNALGLICAFVFTGMFIEKIGEKRRWW